VRNDEAPALSSPANQTRGAEAFDEPFEADRRLDQFPVQFLATRSMIELETMVLPIAASFPHCGRCANK